MLEWLKKKIDELIVSFKMMIQEVLDINLDNYDKKYEWKREDLINYSYAPPTLMNRCRDEFWSNHMSKHFVNTKVNVCIYGANIPNAYTIPGKISLINIGDSITTLAIFAIIFFKSRFIGLLVFMLGMYESYGNAIKAEYNDNTITFDETTKKINCALPEVTVFVASIIIDKFERDEVTAILLHEIGHNTATGIYVMNQIMSVGFVVAFFKFLESLDGHKLIYYKNDSNDYTNNTMFGITMITLFIWAGIIAFRFMQAYIMRAQEYIADDFAIKCGYGKALESGLMRLYSWQKSYRNLWQTEGNTLIKISLVIAKIMTIIGNIILLEPFFPTHPYRATRLKYINDKTTELEKNPV